MDSSIISMIFLVLLVIFFILLVIMTIAIIISNSKKSNNDEKTNKDNSKNIENVKRKKRTTIDESDIEDDSIFAEAENEISNEMSNYDENKDSAFSDANIYNFADAITEELKTEGLNVDANEDDSTVEEAEVDKSETQELETDKSTDEVKEDKEAGDEPDDENVSDSQEEPDNTDESPSEELVDSAFAPEPVETGLTNEEITASVREAEAMGAAVIGGMATTGVTADTIFGISEELARYGAKKKNQRKSNVSSDEDFYWYNRLDIAEKPSYKTAEMYYHYFNLPKECIEDLLIEMYDCALVRTEEIKYIAYGIEPRAVSMKEILSYGNSNYVQHESKKEPTTQDLVRIYEKWCGYVDRLFDKVEIHADDFTIDEIRKLLYEYGRSDVDVLIEGK